MKTFVAFFLVLMTSRIASGQPEAVFHLKEKDLIPEGIAYNADEKCFYVGSINKRKIVQINGDGHVSDFTAPRQEELAEVLGIRVDHKRKWLIALSNEGEANPKGKAWVHIFKWDGSLVKKFSLDAAGEIRLFNDVVVAPAGDIYITDSDGSAIYWIDKDLNALSLWLKADELRYANGITLSPDEKSLVVSTGRGLVKADLASKKVGALPFADYYVVGIDGLYTLGKSLVAVQNVTFPVNIVQYHLNDDGSAVVSANLLAVNDPLFDLPTTGAIAEGWFYFIANTQLRKYKDGKVLEPEKLKEIVIARLKLK
jgi:hypothetical protein